MCWGIRRMRNAARQMLKGPVPITSAEGRSWGGASRLVLVSSRELFLHAHKQTAKHAISSCSGTMRAGVGRRWPITHGARDEFWCCACHKPELKASLQSIIVAFPHH